MKLRERNGEPAREATVSLRTCRVNSKAPWRPQGVQEEVEVNVVEARELAPPPGVEPLHWILLTSLPCAGLAAAEADRGALRDALVDRTVS